MSRRLAVLHAELLKVCTLPAVGCSVLGIGALAAAAGAAAPDTGMVVVAYTQAGFLVLGVSAATSEYAGGQIRSTLLAMPSRVGVTVAKAVSLGLTGGVVAAVAVGAVAAYAPAAATGAAAATAYLGIVTVLGAAVGTLLRGAVPALSGLLGWFVVGAPLLRGNARWVGFLPDVPAAGGAAHGTAVLLGWTLVLLSAAATATHRRDA